MQVLLMLAGMALVLGLVAFATRRRFGVLGLALCAGYVLHQLWSAWLSTYASQLPPLAGGWVSNITVLQLLVILLPSLVLLVRGPVYGRLRGRICGAVLYALLAVVFSLGALASSLVLMGPERAVFEAILSQRDTIMTVAVAIAVVDIAFAYAAPAKPTKSSKAKKAKKTKD